MEESGQFNRHKWSTREDGQSVSGSTIYHCNCCSKFYLHSTCTTSRVPLPNTAGRDFSQSLA